MLISASVFKNTQNIFLDTLIREMFFKKIMKINDFRDDLIDISAKTEALAVIISVSVVAVISVRSP